MTSIPPFPTRDDASISDTFQALITQCSGTTEPTNPRAHQWWADTSGSPVLLKIRNAANTDWVTVLTDLSLSGGGLAVAANFLPLAGGTMTGAIAMGTSKITGVGDATNAQDVTSKLQIDARTHSVSFWVGGITASGNFTLGLLPACTIVNAYLTSDTATAASDGTNNYTFNIRNARSGLTLKAAAKSTNGADIAVDTAYALGLDQNLAVTALDSLLLVVVKNAVPTALTTARIFLNLTLKITT